jgi:16S rRNA (cytosine967-C5)-methyltransferase
MKLHRSTTAAVIQALDLIFAEGRYADKVIEKVLKQNAKWGGRDRRFIAETTYDIVRWYNLFRYIARAKEDEYWKLLGAWCILNGIQLPDWPEFKGLSSEEVLKRHEEAKTKRAIRESIPDWMDELGAKELGDRWESELAALNDEAQVVLRTNTLKISKGELKEKLDVESVITQAIDGFPDALVLEERQNVFGVPSFKEGLFEVQDAASQIIAYFLRVEPGLRVIDACAGAGGKTLHLAALMKNKGRIVAMDIEQWKLDELLKRARRAGVTNLEPRLIDSSKVIKRLENTADRLLLDVPCSGMGVLKRNPDAKWKLSAQFIEEVKATQEKIINDYCKMIKPGGFMVYSTCSMLPSENENQVGKFLSTHEGKYALVEEKHVWPSQGFDGFYMALIKRIE